MQIFLYTNIQLQYKLIKHNWCRLQLALSKTIRRDNDIHPKTCRLCLRASTSVFRLKDISNQNFYCLYLLGILTEYLILYFGRFVAFSC